MNEFAGLIRSFKKILSTLFGSYSLLMYFFPFVIITSFVYGFEHSVVDFKVSPITFCMAVCDLTRYRICVSNDL